jgi:hypothetical protein
LPALRRFSQLIALADSESSFVEQVQAAIDAGREHERAERQAEAMRHSWSRRFEEWERLLACVS